LHCAQQSHLQASIKTIDVSQSIKQRSKGWRSDEKMHSIFVFGGNSLSGPGPVEKNSVLVLKLSAQIQFRIKFE
jgi:hypothetical protein